jgi:hypothetical protein
MRGWSVDRDAATLDTMRGEGVQIESANFNGANFLRANLSKARLKVASFVGANLMYTNLSGAELDDTNFTDARLRRANLQGARLDHANLSAARLRRADARAASFYRANFAGAHCQDTDFRGANLRRARLDTETFLENTLLSTSTEVGDVVWGEAPLAQAHWEEIPKLGDERRIRQARNRRERIRAYRSAARAYRGLALSLRGQGLLIPASRYRIREQQLERRAQLLELKVFAWFGSVLLDWVAGYGERPARAFRAYGLVILLFTAAFFAAAQLFETQLHQLTVDEALVLSVTSFHGRGFFPGTVPLGDWTARLAAVEAVIGLFIELIFIATFSRRFLGN